MNGRILLAPWELDQRSDDWGGVVHPYGKELRQLP
jgi:hypothetical protein